MDNKIFGEIKFVLYIAIKDLMLEIARKYEVFSMLTFALISVLVSSFSFGPYSPYSIEVVPSLIWIIFLFAGMFGFYTTFTREMEQHTIDGLKMLPISFETLLIGKILYGFLLMISIEAVVVPLSMIFFGYSFNSNVLFVILVFILGSLDFAIVGVVVSSLTMYTESRTILIPMLTFPLVLPVIIPAVTLTRKLISGIVFSSSIPEVSIMIFSLIPLFVASILLSDHILSE